jgi:autotransporter-associated beta strand protein
MCGMYRCPMQPGSVQENLKMPFARTYARQLIQRSRLIAPVVLLAAAAPAIAADATGAFAVDQAWLNNSNWTPAAFPGETGNLASVSTDIATLTGYKGTSSNAGWGVNFSAANANGHLGLGAVVFDSSLVVGGSDLPRIGATATADGSGILTLNGATVNAVPGTIISQNYVGGSITVGGTITSGSTATLGLRLGNTTGNVVHLATGSRLSVTAIISERSAGSQLTKTGKGQVIFGGANTFTGGLVVKDGPAITPAFPLASLSVPIGSISPSTSSNTGAGTGPFGTGPVSFQNTADAAVLYAANSANVTLANDVSFTSTSGVTSQLVIGNGSGTGGAYRSLQLDGKLSGGVAGSMIQINSLDSRTGGTTPNTLSILRLTNSANTFKGTLKLAAGTLAITNAGALGDAGNILSFEQSATQFGTPTAYNATTNPNPNTHIGGLRFEGANIAVVQASVFQGSFGINVNGFNGGDLQGNITNGTAGTGTVNIWGGVTTSGTTAGSVRFSGTNNNSANYAVQNLTKLIVVTGQPR